MKRTSTTTKTLDVLLDTWPELHPDPQVMERLSRGMSQRLTSLKAREGEASMERLFRLILWVWGVAAIGIYAAWPLFSDLIAEYPSLPIVIICLGATVCLAPILILPWIHPDEGNTASIKPGGHSPC